MLKPIFSVQDVAAENSVTKESTPTSEASKAPESSKNPPVRKIAKASAGNFSTPSVKDALMGRYKNGSQLSAKEQHKMYSNVDQKELFTAEELKTKWEAFVARLDDRPNLQSTLAYVPELKEGFQLYLEIENTVQEDLINSIKTELVSWLRKELKNSKINLITAITEKIKGRIIYTDAEKFEELLKKNPTLALLKQKLNLDFGQ